MRTPCTYIRVPSNCNGDTILCTTTNLGEVTIDLRQLLVTEFGDGTSLSVHRRRRAHRLYHWQSHPDGHRHPDGRAGDGETHCLRPHPERQCPGDAASRRYDGNELPAHDYRRPGAHPDVRALRQRRLLHHCHVADEDADALHAALRPAPTSSRASTGTTATSSRRSSTLGSPWSGRAWSIRGGMGIFTDHTDTRPTLLTLAGVKDDHAHDGRVIVEALDERSAACSRFRVSPPPTSRSTRRSVSSADARSCSHHARTQRR